MGCGICGFVGLSDRSLLRSMCESIRHRGPDQTDYYIDDNVGLGIDRLKIIDLATGDQPIHNEDGSIWVVFNGEIYNYLELKGQLEQLGHRFYTASDTETLVHAYETWGDDCVDHLRGMFAFAIWDAKNKRLFIARDRFGKKPLYYAMIGSTFLFASELKAILQFDAVPRTMDYAAIDHFFTYMYVPSPLSIFSEIRKLPPASYAVYEEGRLSTHQYWDFSPRPDGSLTEEAAIDMLYSSIEDAVKIRMKSDVPLGAFLSGGIDSSVVVALMSKLSSHPIRTVSIGFENETSETAYARRVADFLDTDHHEYTVAPEAYKILPRLIWHFDEPFADHSMIPTYYLSEITRQQVTVALSGDGGDELFMGYPFLLDPRAYPVYSKVPGPLRRPALKALTSLPVDKQFKRMAQHAYEKDYGEQSYVDRFAMRVTLHDRAGLERLYAKSHLARHKPVDTYSYLKEMMANCSSQDSLDRVDYATIRSYLEEDILVKVDRMTMAVSLEARCPLLDQRLAELVATIPSRLKLRGRTTKYIFKKMAVKKHLVPREIALRRKQGFGAPIESWMRREWEEMVAQALDPVISRNYTGLFDSNHVRSLAAQPYLNSNKIFAMLAFLTWYRMYIEEAATRPPKEMQVAS